MASLFRKLFLQKSISVIAWDGGFRESFHTIDCFGRQSLSKRLFEFVWVDYYGGQDAARNRINQLKNFRLVSLNKPGNTQWHLGEMINTAASQAANDYLLIVDGDIAVDDDFLETVCKNYLDKDIVTYVRRYDGPALRKTENSPLNLKHLKKQATLINPTNFAGCLIISKKQFLYLKGFEQSSYFSGPGMIAKEFYVRLRNAGIPVRWASDICVFHPSHEGSGMPAQAHQIETLKRMATNNPWIVPYSGLFQSWIVRNRELNLDQFADANQCDAYINSIPKELIQELSNA